MKILNKIAWVLLIILLVNTVIQTNYIVSLLDMVALKEWEIETLKNAINNLGAK